MLAALLLAILLIVASEATRGFGFILLALLLYRNPGVFASMLIILGILWLFRR